MSPKPDALCLNPVVSSMSLNNDDENETNVNDDRAVDRSRTVCKFEHSFSQSELDHFKAKSSNIHDLRSDFVHLHSIAVHPKNSSRHFPSHEETREGFQFRSIRAITKPTSKIVVVVPSIDLDCQELQRLCDSIEFYEERQLYHLLLANDPSVRIIYLSSNPVNEKVAGYYLGLCRRKMGNEKGSQMDNLCKVHQMLSRVMMIYVPSDECIALSEKILHQLHLTALIKHLICSSFNGCESTGVGNTAVGLSVFTGSDSIDCISKQLGIRLLEASGNQLHYGTKQGSREIFAACGLNFPRGTPDLPDDNDLLSCAKDQTNTRDWAQKHHYIRSARELSVGIARQIAKGVKPRKWMIKLNQGFSGKGNASIDLRSKIYDKIQSEMLPVTEMAALILAELPNMKFEEPKMTWHDTDEHVGFETQIRRLGVIAEQFIEGEVPTSPSIQAVIEPKDQRVSIISTHEQLLDGQVYNGCINPASDQYRSKIMEMGLKVGKYMAARGVVGHFSVDFMANEKQDGSWDINAVEVNLRQGGTTHPHAMMALLCGGCICSDGLFRNNSGEVRTYIATDTYYNPKLKGLSENQIVDAIECKNDKLAKRIRWNKIECVGVTFHLFKFVEKHARIGFTAIGRSKDEAQMLYDATIKFLEAVGQRNQRRRQIYL